MGPDKFETGPLRDLTGSVPKCSHKNSPKLDPRRTSSRRSRVNARPIWTQSGTSPKFIQSRVNGTIAFEFWTGTRLLIYIWVGVNTPSSIC